MITLDSYFGDKRGEYQEDYTSEVHDNAVDLLERVNKLLAMHEGQEVLRSGWRPRAYNEKVPGASKNSKHITGNAVDVADLDGSLGRWCLANEKYLIDFGLWCEHPDYTKTWVHFQNLPPKSGKRFYKPF